MFAALALVPRSAWIVLAVLSILGLGSCAHSRSVKKHYAEAYAQGKADEAARIAKRVKELEAKANAISAKIRSETDAKARDINNRADGLRVRGPGAARCSIPSPASSGHKQATPQGSPAVDQVPDGEGAELIGLPFAPTVQLGENHDLLLNEVKAWRKLYDRLVAEWGKQP